MIYICNFHILSHLLLIYICKLHWNHWNFNTMFVYQDRLYSIELNPDCCEWTRRVLSKAHLLDSKVELVQGSADVGLELLHCKHITHIDLLFIDHDKALYLADLILFEQSGLLRTGKKKRKKGKKKEKILRIDKYFSHLVV